MWHKSIIIFSHIAVAINDLLHPSGGKTQPVNVMTSQAKAARQKCLCGRMVYPFIFNILPCSLICN